MAIYLALFSLLFMGVSCNNGDDWGLGDTATPYAYVSAFSIDNIKCPFHDFTVDGRDTIVEKLVSGEEFEFVIDQKSNEIYNIDSLTYGTKVDKVVSYLSCTGTPYRYDAAQGVYVYYSSSDSVDFTSPVSVRINSTDGTYENYYTVKLNVHQVNPDLMVWNTYSDAALSGVTPVKMVEKAGKVYLFGTDAAGAYVVAETLSEGTPSWSVTAISLPTEGDLSSLLLFGNRFYALVSGDIYVSDDAVVWNVAAAGNGFVSLFAVSDNGATLWAAGADALFSSADGENFAQVQALPSGFPLYGCSYVNSTLSTNASINRTILVGYSTADKSGKVSVWCNLSTGGEWYGYGEDFGGGYPCPPFSGLAVLGYDNAMYAFGGAAALDGMPLKAFSRFYISRDNGIVWKQCTDYAVSLPAELKDKETAFAALASQDEYMWIATPDAVYKGRINRLGFK